VLKASEESIFDPIRSVDLYISPKAPSGMESNWLQSIPGKSFFVALRMYGPLKPWINKSWRPGEVEPVEWSQLMPRSNKRSSTCRSDGR
jgi:hypothetical protein